MWAVLAILAAGLWAISNVIDKWAIRYLKSPVFCFVLAGLLSGPAAVLVLPFAQIQIPLILLAVCLLCGVLYVLAIGAYFLSIVQEEVSRVIPLLLFVPVFVLLLATLFLGEIFTLPRYLGIGLLVVGAVLICLKRKATVRITRLMAFTSAVFAINTIAIAWLFHYLDFPTVFFWLRLGSFVLGLCLLASLYFKFKRTLFAFPRPSAWLAVSQGISYSASGLFVAALGLGFASLVTALTQVQPLIVLALALALSELRQGVIKEELDRKVILFKVLAVVTMVTGAVLVIL